MDRRVFKGKADLRPRSVFFLRANKERRMGKIPETFDRNAQGFGGVGAGSCASFADVRSPPPRTSVL